MQEFYVIIKKDFLFLYERNDASYERVYLEGNDKYAYEINRIEEGMNAFLSLICDEYNLDSTGEIDLIAILNEDKIISDAIVGVLGENIIEQIDIYQLLDNVLRRLERDKELYINQYGINYDGKNYVLDQEQLKKGEFSLLAYTVSEDMLMRNIR